MVHTGSIAGTAALAAAALAGAAHAVVVLGNGQSVRMGDLMAAGSDRKVLVGDKLFTFQALSSSTMSTANVLLVGYVSEDTNRAGIPNYGFDLVGNFGDPTPGNGGMSEMNLRYQVEVEASAYAAGYRLCDVGLTFNGSSSGTGSFARVDETVFDLDQNRFLGNLSAYHKFGPPVQWRPSETRDFCAAAGQPDGFRAFEVNKDIKFLAAGPNGSAGATFVRQEFGQIHTPGPGAVALLGISGAAGARRRRRIA
jgi:hypothetical protein